MSQEQIDHFDELESNKVNQTKKSTVDSNDTDNFVNVKPQKNGPFNRVLQALMVLLVFYGLYQYVFIGIYHQLRLYLLNNKEGIAEYQH